jgi:hypothetical protein
MGHVRPRRATCFFALAVASNGLCPPASCAPYAACYGHVLLGLKKRASGMSNILLWGRVIHVGRAKRAPRRVFTYVGGETGIKTPHI